MVKMYREAYGMFACNGILFNHESPRRGEDFVTMKIAKAVARIQRGKQDVLYLGNLDARRDWGHAADYVEGMWRMLQQDKPDDFVLATGETHTVREFVAEAFFRIGQTVIWGGDGKDEYGFIAGAGHDRPVVKVDPKLYRPAEVDVLCGDASKAKEVLGWEPQTKFRDLVDEMVRAEIVKLDKIYGEK